MRGAGGDREEAPGGTERNQSHIPNTARKVRTQSPPPLGLKRLKLDSSHPSGSALLLILTNSTLLLHFCF